MNYVQNPYSHLRFLTNPTKVTYTGTAGRTAQLSPGLYYITSDQDCYVLQGDSSVDATTSSIPLWAGTYMLIRVRDNQSALENDAYVSAIQVSSGGTLWAIPAGP